MSALLASNDLTVASGKARGVTGQEDKGVRDITKEAEEAEGGPMTTGETDAGREEGIHLCAWEMRKADVRGRRGGCCGGPCPIQLPSFHNADGSPRLLSALFL